MLPEERLVLGAHRRGVHLDHRPIAFGLRLGHLDEGGLALAGDDGFFHRMLLSALARW